MKLQFILCYTNLTTLVLARLPAIIAYNNINFVCNPKNVETPKHFSNFQKREAEPLSVEHYGISRRLEIFYAQLMATVNETGIDHDRFTACQKYWDLILGILDSWVARSKFEWALFNQFVFINKAFETLKRSARFSSSFLNSNPPAKHFINRLICLNARILTLYTSHGTPNFNIYSLSERISDYKSDLRAWRSTSTIMRNSSADTLILLSGEMARAKEALEDLDQQLPENIAAHLSSSTGSEDMLGVSHLQGNALDRIL